MPAPKPAAALDQAFAEAIAYFRRKSIVTPEEWATFDAKAKRRAFSVAGIAQRDILHDAWKSLHVAIAEGKDFRAWKAEVGEKLTTAWGGSVAAPGWRLQTIFRTNVQSAFMAGRYQAATLPAVMAARPYWQFRAIDDGRTTEICQHCNGTIRPADDPWWKGHLPPLHFSCRSGFITLTVAQHLERGGVTKKPTSTAADDGFGAPPDLGDIEAVAEDKNSGLPPALQPSGGTPKPRNTDGLDTPPATPPATEPGSTPPKTPRHPGEPEGRDPVEPPPWWPNDGIPRPRGAITADPGARVLPKEQALAEELADQGTHTHFREEAAQKGKNGKSADSVMGRETPTHLVEMKRLERATVASKNPPWKALYNRINDSLSGDGQARNLIVDVRLRPEIAEDQLPALLEQIRAFRRGRIDWLRVIGVGFDVTLRGP